MLGASASQAAKGNSFAHVCEHTHTHTLQRKTQGKPGERLVSATPELLAIPPTTVTEVRTASATFTTVTPLTDDCHPRHFRLLSDEALEGLRKILYAAVALGDVPLAQRPLFIAMLSKPTGGFFSPWVGSSVYGPQSGGNLCKVGTRGRTSVDTVWKQAIRAESAVGTSRCSVSVFRDRCTCCELASHSQL